LATENNRKEGKRQKEKGKKEGVRGRGKREKAIEYRISNPKRYQRGKQGTANSEVRFFASLRMTRLRISYAAAGGQGPGGKESRGRK